MRQDLEKQAVEASKFQSTHRVSDATGRHRRSLRVFQFQSTHRVSDATTGSEKMRQLDGFQSTHRVSDATKHNGTINWDKVFQYTHRVSDATIAKDRKEIERQLFQSTHRVSDATRWGVLQYFDTVISIHAPRERCDGFSFKSLFSSLDFNPRTA